MDSSFFFLHCLHFFVDFVDFPLPLPTVFAATFFSVFELLQVGKLTSITHKIVFFCFAYGPTQCWLSYKQTNFFLPQSSRIDNEFSLSFSLSRQCKCKNFYLLYIKLCNNYYYSSCAWWLTLKWVCLSDEMVW